MHIAVAPFRLNSGMTEEDLLKASDDFEVGFAQLQDGIVRRALVRDPNGGYADVVFFESEEAMGRVFEAEQDDEICAQYMSLMNAGELVIYQALRTYE